MTYTRRALREWWVNGPAGLEQGFQIARPPAGSGALTLTIAVPAGAHLAHGSVLLPGGLRYTAVHASDADGRALPAWLEVRDGRALVRVDDIGARYPVRIDPIVEQTAELSASDGVADNWLGFSVAISSGASTIVVGAPCRATCSVSFAGGQGAVYVFTESAGV